MNRFDLHTIEYAKKLSEGWETLNDDQKVSRACLLLVRCLKRRSGCPTSESTGLPQVTSGEPSVSLLSMIQYMYFGATFYSGV